MSSHADTIREFLDELRRINAETGASAAKQFMWKNRELVVELLAEIERLEHERNFLQRELGFKNTQRQEIQRLRDALADEALMLEQSVKTLREMRGDWRELTEEFEGGYLIEQYLDSLIEDLSPDSAREALAGDAE